MTAEEEPELLDPRQPAQLVGVEDAANRLFPCPRRVRCHGTRRDGAALGDLDGGRWDWVVVALYPSRAAFLSMMTSAEYAIANVDRENGVEDHVILAANQSYSKFQPG